MRWLAAIPARVYHPQMLMKLEAKSKTAHFTDLDGLRGVLALTIVLLHFGFNTLIRRATYGVLPGFVFQLSVDFFFLLSGYVLAHSARRGVSAWAFARRRAWRLLPVYFVTLAAMVTIGLTAPSPAPYLTPNPSLSRVIADFLLLYPVVDVAPLNVPAWSIPWEFFLPIAAVAIAPWLPLGQLPRSLLFIAILVSSLLAWRVGLEERWHGARAFAGLLAGAMLYRHSLPVSGRWLWPLLVAMTAIMAITTRIPFVAVLFAPCACATFLSGTNTHTLLSSPPAAYLGRISYPFYMVHVPVYAATAAFMPGIFGSPLTKGVDVILSLVAATILGRTIERWGMNRGRSAR